MRSLTADACVVPTASNTITSKMASARCNGRVIPRRLDEVWSCKELVG